MLQRYLFANKKPKIFEFFLFLKSLPRPCFASLMQRYNNFQNPPNNSINIFVNFCKGSVVRGRKCLKRIRDAISRPWKSLTRIQGIKFRPPKIANRISDIKSLPRKILPWIWDMKSRPRESLSPISGIIFRPQETLPRIWGRITRPGIGNSLLTRELVEWGSILCKCANVQMRFSMFQNIR